MKISVRSGSALAAAAASLMLAGAVMAPAHAADGDKGACNGANACKGTSACKTATSACKGQNACKGHGWIEATRAECEKVAGASFSPIKPGQK